MKDSETLAKIAKTCHATGSYDNKKAVHRTAEFIIGSGGWNRTNYLQVMSLTSYQCSTPQTSHYYIIPGQKCKRGRERFPEINPFCVEWTSFLEKIGTEPAEGRGRTLGISQRNSRMIAPSVVESNGQRDFRS